MPKETARSRFGWGTAAAALVWGAIVFGAITAAQQVDAFAKTDEQFTLERPRSFDSGPILIDGAHYASRARILRIFEPDVGRSVFLMPLAERRRRLLAVDWVENATVSRLWPNRIWIRITERQPVAFIPVPLDVNAGARLALIDREGVILEQPPKARFTFPILSGVTAEQPEAERKRRVTAMLGLMQDLGEAAQQISEVSVAELDNLSVVAQVEGTAVDLMLGDMNYRERFQNFLAHYPEIRKRTPYATGFDLRLEDRITARQ